MLFRSGVLSIGFGVLLFAAPGAGALALVGVIAGYAILYGVLLVVLGVRLERWRRANERTFSGGAPSHA